jgi:hypothetical protein
MCLFFFQAHAKDLRSNAAVATREMHAKTNMIFPFAGVSAHLPPSHLPPVRDSLKVPATDIPTPPPVMRKVEYCT